MGYGIEIGNKSYDLYTGKLRKKGMKLNFTISDKTVKVSDKKSCDILIPSWDIIDRKSHKHSSKVEIHELHFKPNERETHYLYFVTPYTISKEVLETVMENSDFYNSWECKDVRVCRGLYTELGDTNRTLKIVSKQVDMGKIMYCIIFVMLILVAVNIFLLGKGLWEILSISAALP